MSITVTDAAERERYEAHDGDALAGYMTYQVTGRIIAITHTRVDPAFEGTGVGGALARYAMEDAVARGRTVVPICPFLSGWLARHPGYEESVAHNTKKVR